MVYTNRWRENVTLIMYKHTRVYFYIYLYGDRRRVREGSRDREREIDR